MPSGSSRRSSKERLPRRRPLTRGLDLRERGEQTQTLETTRKEPAAMKIGVPSLVVARKRIRRLKLPTKSLNPRKSRSLK